MDYAYPCLLTHDDGDASCYLVTFPNLPEALTAGATREESLLLAEDALVVLRASTTSPQLSARWGAAWSSGTAPHRKSVAPTSPLAEQTPLRATGAFNRDDGN